MHNYGEPDEISVVLTAANGRQYVHSSRLTSLEIEVASPGGEMSASWSVTEQEPYDLILAAPSASVELYDRQGRFRHLRLERPGGHFAYSEADLEFVARGYSSHAGDDKFADSQIYTAGTPLGEVFKHARDTLCPQLSDSDLFIDAGGTYLLTDSDDFGGKTAKAVFNAMAALGNLQWHVWSQDIGQPYLEVRPYPTEPEYIIKLADGAESDMGWDLQNLYNRVLIKWAEGYVHADDLESQKDYPEGVGVRRTYFLDLSGSIAEEGSAQQIADSLILNFGAIPIDGLGLTVHYGVPIYLPGNAIIPPWRTQAGRMVEMQGVSTGELLMINQFICQQIIWSEDGRECTFVPVPQDVTTDLVLGGTRATVISSGSGGSSSSVGTGGSGSIGGGSGSGSTIVGGYVVPETTYDQAPDIGNSGIPADRLHTHGTPPEPAIPSVGRYRSLVYEVSGGDFTFIHDGSGEPVYTLEDLE